MLLTVVCAPVCTCTIAVQSRIPHARQFGDDAGLAHLPCALTYQASAAGWSPAIHPSSPLTKVQTESLERPDTHTCQEQVVGPTAHTISHLTEVPLRMAAGSCSKLRQICCWIVFVADHGK